MKCAVPYQMMHHGHVKMLNDQARNSFFQKALQQTAQDRVVLDVGTGTGLLAAYALQAGARFVYAVERDEHYARMAQNILAALFDASRFQVILADFWTTDIDDKIPRDSVEVIVSENVGPALFEEGQDFTWHCARPFLKSDAISIPDRLHIDVVGFHGIYRPPMINIDDLDLSPEKTHYEDLHGDNLLFPEFYDQLQQYVSRYNCHSWMDLRAARPPDWIIKDAYSMTKDTLPKMTFTDLPYPQHMDSELEFEVSIPGPCTVSLLGHISFRDTTLTLNGTCYPCSPAVKFTRAGQYRFRINPERPVATNNIWFIQELEPKENL
jgi:predicted RNA methylase